MLIFPLGIIFILTFTVLFLFMSTGVSYEDALRDGIIFCKLMNRLQPGIISKINVSGGDYKMMDNLNQ